MATWYPPNNVEPFPMIYGEPLTAGEAIYPRIVSGATPQLTTQVMMVTFWTAATSGAATAVTTATGGVAGNGLTYAGVGIYSVNPSSTALTLLASTGDVHSTSWGSTYTGYTSALTSTFNRVAGTRYAAGFLAVGGTVPTLTGATGAGAFQDTPPIMSATVSGQGTIPTSVAGTAVTPGYQMPLVLVFP